jgi:hypothetical protein
VAAPEPKYFRLQKSTHQTMENKEKNAGGISKLIVEFKSKLEKYLKSNPKVGAKTNWENLYQEVVEVEKIWSDVIGKSKRTNESDLAPGLAKVLL